ncbi:uncharacterized protein LOC125654096 isoform X2 [Ostrea edulis]|uniref:uncharacterized protein LOC125654096 isoform X2 n=1 Tax=Ostrea edulis TaxID=37623 RepID=UPI0024AE9907|nr:uncharacterized protein LOC125654096 isoform X2 [Ostrea edulis]XP_048739836.2 uncharacterized protein LOC125654096 isoform X2 [Ostrea edulis]
MGVNRFCFSLCVCSFLVHRSSENEITKVLEKVNGNITQILTIWGETLSSHEIQNCRHDFVMHFREYNLNASSYSLTMESFKEHQYFNVCFHVENDNIGANGVTKLCITKTPLANLHKEGNKAAKVLGITENTQGYLMKCTVTESLKTSTSSKNQTKKFAYGSSGIKLKAFPDSGWFICGMAVGIITSSIVFCAIWNYNLLKHRKMEKIKKKHEVEDEPIYHELKPIYRDPAVSGHVNEATTFAVTVPFIGVYKGRKPSGVNYPEHHRETPNTEYTDITEDITGESLRDEHIANDSLQELKPTDEIPESDTDNSSPYFVLANNANHTVTDKPKAAIYYHTGTLSDVTNGEKSAVQWRDDDIVLRETNARMSMAESMTINNDANDDSETYFVLSTPRHEQ